MIKLLLVPQGQEYQAVCRGARGSGVRVIPIPMGNPEFRSQLVSYLAAESLAQAVLIGLCGGIAEGDLVGDWVIYQSCSNHQELCSTDRNLTSWIKQKLGDQAKLVNGLTVNSVVTSIVEKRNLRNLTSARYVDMESYEVLDFAQPQAMAVVRVVSDNLQRDLPNLNFALEQGRLNVFKLAIALMREPINSAFLISNSLVALRRLEQCTRTLVS